MMKLETITRTIVGLGIAAVCATAQTAGAQPCSGPDACGPGENWIDGCGAGTDEIPSSKAEVGIYLTDDCSGDPLTNLVLFGPATIERQEEADGTIVTEITNMSLEGGSARLTVGAGLEEGPGVLQQSTGTIVATGDPKIGLSSFYVYFELFEPGIGGYAYNQEALVILADITCVPPKAEYLHTEGQCIKLLNAVGVTVGYLGDAAHGTFEFPIPTVSEWGLIVMTLIILTVGTVILGRRRKASSLTTG